ncbi:MAG: hypothetical protein QGH49_14940, partial [SAR324 cluster bacterium]|nr:hypothetical protein [SAR324 cluster bacterium]
MANIPGYVRLYETGVLENRVNEAIASLGSCRVCPWNCEINRLADEWKVCRTGRYARVSSCFPHFGEEDCLRGAKGSGTIFFSWCNLGPAEKEVMQTEPVQVIVLILAEAPKTTPETLPICPLVEIPKGFSG